MLAECGKNLRPTCVKNAVPAMTGGDGVYAFVNREDTMRSSVDVFSDGDRLLQLLVALDHNS